MLEGNTYPIFYKKNRNQKKNKREVLESLFASTFDFDDAAISWMDKYYCFWKPKDQN